MKAKKVIAKTVLGDTVESYYLIYEDGKLWGTRSHRFIKAQVNRCGYYIYPLQHIYGKCFLAHTLVALMFIGDPPSDKHEVNHKDLDKRNNHYTNLEWVTHSYNMHHARKANPWDCGRLGGFSVSAETKAKMSRAKFKPVRCIRGDEERVYGSIGEFLEAFETYRKKFNRVVNSIQTIDGWSIRYA